MKMKGVLYGAELDEYTTEQVTDNNQQKTKATIKVSFPGGYTKDAQGQGKREYCRLRISTTSNYFLERLQALNIPLGKQPQGAPKVQLVIPFKDLYWTLWNGNSGPGVTGYADLDGEPAWCQMAPKPQRQNGNGNGQWQGNHQGGQGQQNFQQPVQNQQQFQGQPQQQQFAQPVQNQQFAQPQQQFAQPQQQGNFQQGPPQQQQFAPPVQNQQFPQQNPPGFQGQPTQPAAPYQQGQPFPQPQQQFQQGGHDPFTVPQ